MSWSQAIRGWNELYENSPKVQKFFEDAAPTIAKHTASYFTSPATGEVIGKAISIGSETNSGIRKVAGIMAYGAAVGLGTAVVGLAATATAPIWIPIAIIAGSKKE